MHFEVRDVVRGPIYSDSLSSTVLDNSNIIVALDLEELFLNLCNPLGGTTAHVLYTVYHAHMNNVSLSISNNTGTVHGAPANAERRLPAWPQLFLPRRERPGCTTEPTPEASQ